MNNKPVQEPSREVLEFYARLRGIPVNARPLGYYWSL